MDSEVRQPAFWPSSVMISVALDESPNLVNVSVLICKVRVIL